MASVDITPLKRSTGAVERSSRDGWADNLKIALVTGVIVAYATIAWTGIGNRVLQEAPVRPAT